MVYHKPGRPLLALQDTNVALFPPAVNEDGNEMEKSISESEQKLRAVDLKVTTIQRTLDAIYNAKVEAHPSVVRPLHSILGLVASRSPKSRRNFDTEISETQQLLDRLIEKRHRLQMDIFSQKSALARRNALNSSMGRLPMELWAQIFMLCLPAQDFIEPDPLQAPLLLCQVCGFWRTVATNTPLLWSSLSIRHSFRPHVWKSSLESWLTRSGDAFLYLDISTPVNIHFETKFDDHIFKLIVSSAHRWYHLRLNVTNQFLRSVLNRRMPKLHTLESSSAYPISSLVIPAAHVPSLQVVSFLTKLLHIPPVFLPWSQLTSLSSVCWLDIREHIDILRKCPNLEVYRMSLIQIDVPPEYSSPVLMQHLKVLEILCYIGSAMGTILSQLQLPSLAELAFIVPAESPAYRITDWPKAHVTSLIERSSSPLTKLSLQGVCLSYEDIVDTKKLIPTLKLIEVL